MLGLDFLRALQKEDFLENLEVEPQKEENSKSKEHCLHQNCWIYMISKNIWKVGKLDTDLSCRNHNEAPCLNVCQFLL